MILLLSSSNALLFIISLSSFLASRPCHAFRCFPSPSSLLPPYRDCRIIIAGIDWLSTRATERGPRDWGRAVHSAATTERLPKFFMIQGRQPPNECAVEIDVDPIDYYAIDTFTLEEVAEAAKVVYWRCMVGKAMVGLEYPNVRQRRVWAKLVRLDFPRGDFLEGEGEGRRVLGLAGSGNASMVIVDGRVGGRGGDVGVERK